MRCTHGDGKRERGKKNRRCRGQSGMKINCSALFFLLGELGGLARWVSLAGPPSRRGGTVEGARKRGRIREISLIAPKIVITKL